MGVALLTIDPPGSTGNQTYSLPSGFDPKIVMAATADATADTHGDLRMSHGMGTYEGGSVQQWYESLISADATASSSYGRGLNSTAILKGYSAFTTPTVAYEARLVSLGSGAGSNVVINWVSLPDITIRVFLFVIGGSNITAARCGTFSQVASVNTQAITVAAGWGKPDFLFFSGASGGSATFGDFGNTNALGGFGFAKSPTDRACVSTAARGAQATMQTYGGDHAAAVEAWNSVANGSLHINLDAAANYPTDGFQIAYSAQQVTNARNSIGYCAVKLSDPSLWKIGTGGAPVTGSTTQTLTPTTGSAKGVIFINHNQTSQPSATAADLMGYGCGFFDGTNQGSCGGTDKDNNADAETGRYHSESYALRMMKPGATATSAPAEVRRATAATNGDNIDITFPSLGAELRWYGYLLIAESGGTTTPQSVSDSATVSEAASIAITAQPGEAFALGETLVLNATPAALDSGALSEATQLALAASLTDSGVVTEDAVGLQGSLSALDQGTVSEAIAAAATLAGTEAWLLTESAVASEFADKLVSDSFALTESATLTEQVFKAASDAAVLSELAQAVSVDLLIASDSFSITETLNVSAALAVTDLAALVEAATKLETLAIDLSDSLTLSESVGIAAAALANDSLTLSELGEASEFSSKVASDSFTVSEVAALETVIFKAAADTLALSEASALSNTLSGSDIFTLSELLTQTSAALAAAEQHTASETAAIAATLATLDAFDFEDASLLDDAAFVRVLGAVVSLALTLQGAAGATLDVSTGESSVVIDVPGTTSATVG